MRVVFPKWLFLCACVLFSCSTSPYRSPGEYFGGSLLGPGAYLQDVKAEGWEKKELHFQCIFQRRPTGVMVTGLTESGSPIFRVKDSLGANARPSVEIMGKAMEAHRERLFTFFEGFRALLILNDKPALPNDLVRERWPDRRPKRLSPRDGLDLYVDEFDWDGHAYKLTLQTPTWKARISLREYTTE